MHILIISSSLRALSRSKLLAQRAHDYLSEKEISSELLDLSEYDLPLCDGETYLRNPVVKAINEKVLKASAIIIALPIYNFAAAASAKNFIELTGESFREKVVGFIAAASGSHSYMGVLPLVNSLQLDFRCLIVPKYVFADLTDIAHNGTLMTSEIEERLKELAITTFYLATSWKKIQEKQ
jgi:NAD(P)H-dependent FMN reductase